MKIPKRTRYGSSAEFPVVALLLFTIFAFPLINMVSLGAAYATIWYISFQSALNASVQTTFSEALQRLKGRSDQFNSTGFTTMLRMNPKGGYSNCGTDLVIESVDFMDAAKNVKYGPNLAVPPPIDLTNRFFEISANSKYEVAPFVNLSAVPFLKDVPGIGRPLTLTATVSRCAEFPQGLTRGPFASGTAATGPLTGTNTSFAGPISLETETDGPWNRPGLYDEIAASGQQIVDHVVVQVKAANPLWTQTGLTVHPGQTVWIDFRADGQWGQTGTALWTDADGSTGGMNTMIGSTAVPSFSLLGSVSPKDTWIKPTSPDFIAGTALYKYSPTKTGPIVLGCANNLFDGGGFVMDKDLKMETWSLEQSTSGEMTVRIVITQ